MATHSSILAWRIPWTEEPGRQWPMMSPSQTQVSDLHFTSCCIASFLFTLFVQQDNSMQWNYETGLYVWSNLNPFIHSANIYWASTMCQALVEAWGLSMNRNDRVAAFKGIPYHPLWRKKRDDFICLVWFLSDVGWAGNRHSGRQRRHVQAEDPGWHGAWYSRVTEREMKPVWPQPSEEGDRPRLGAL